MDREPIDYGALEEGRHVNYWDIDPTLRRAARRTYPDEEFEWARDRLSALGEAVGHTVADNADRIDSEGHELRTYDAHGDLANEVVYHPLQAENDRIAYGHGTVSDAWHAPEGRERPPGLAHSLYMGTLLSYADAGLVCAVSMTTGAAIVLERFGESEIAAEYAEALTTTDLDEHVQGAMFLTEYQGGSDVGAAETTAEPTDEDGVYELYGEKWFCSNIDAEGTLALARRPDAPDGTEGLSLFLVPHTKRSGELNDQVYRRLKDKLGTVSVPTGEVVFEGAEAHLIGDPERGFRYMTAMLNYERLTNATGSQAAIARALLESKVHAANREAFGETIDQYPLLRRDLVTMQVDYEAAAAFTGAAIRFYDRFIRHEAGPGDRLNDDVPEDLDRETAHKLFRLLVPIAKYRLGRLCVDTASYAMEVLGGNGYVEDFVTARLLRDAQVTPIWEGTSNILSLDVLRVLETEDAHEALLPYVEELLSGAEHPRLAAVADVVEAAHGELGEALVALAGADEDEAQHEAKQLADLIYDVVAGALLVDRAQERVDAADDARLVLVAEWFARTRFEDRPARGIADGDRLPDDFYDEICRYAPIAPADLAAAATGDH